MKLGIYADAHFSRNSSSLNMSNGYKYSARLDMLVDSFKWMYDKFEEENVDIIINAGDLLDSTILDPMTNSALSEALSYSKGIEEIHVLGNHEKESIDGKINSISLLSGFKNISIITEPTKINEEISVLPYMQDSNLEELDLSEISNKLLISHVNYKGMPIRGQVSLSSGLNMSYATNYFDLILNGHIHSANQLCDGKLVNIGSIVGHGYGDSYSKSLPSIMIVDTESMKWERVINPYSVIFISLNIKSIGELSKKLDEYDKSIKKCIKVSVPDSIRLNVSKYIEDISRKYSIISSRVIISIHDLIKNQGSTEDVEISKVDSYESSYSALINYVNSIDKDKLPSSRDKVIKFIENYMR